MNRPSYILLVAGAMLFLLCSVLFASGSGAVKIPLEQLYAVLLCPSNACSVDPTYFKILWDIRLPRILMALISGAGLAVVGAVLQAVTRNPLADPYLFGISSGSALGAVIVMTLLSTASISVTLGALAGGIFSVFLILVLAGSSVRQIDRLLLSGVAVSFLLSAFTSLILYYTEPEAAARLLFWMMGSFSNSQWNDLWLPISVLSMGFALFFMYRRWLTALQAGDESAHTLGVPVENLRLMMLLTCALMTAVLVAHVGGIGFVGLMIPHIARFIVGTQIHRTLVMSFLIGGAFMIWVDVIAQSLLPDQVLPVGIVTSALGSLFFFFILKQRSHSH